MLIAFYGMSDLVTINFMFWSAWIIVKILELIDIKTAYGLGCMNPKKSWNPKLILLITFDLGNLALYVIYHQKDLFEIFPMICDLLNMDIK